MKKILILSSLTLSLFGQWMNCPPPDLCVEKKPFIREVNITPVFNFIKTYGQYQFTWKETAVQGLWTINPQFLGSVNMNDWFNFVFVVQAFYKHRDITGFPNQQAFRFGDFIAGVNIPLYIADPCDRAPNVSLTLSETFPTGHYRNLNGARDGTDSSGNGTYLTGIALLFKKVHLLPNHHRFETRLDFRYSIPTIVHVTGFNTYGGGFGTNGRLKPGQNIGSTLGFLMDVAVRSSLSIAFAGDYTVRRKFTGFPGVDADGGTAVMGNNSSANIGYGDLSPDNTGYQWLFSVNPAFSYQIRKDMSITGAGTISIAGRNTDATAGGSVNYNYNF